MGLALGGCVDDGEDTTLEMMTTSDGVESDSAGEATYGVPITEDGDSTSDWASDTDTDGTSSTGAPDPDTDTDTDTDTDGTGGLDTDTDGSSTGGGSTSSTTSG